MKGAMKILTLLLCASICAAGAILSLKQTAPDHLPKNNAVPIDNREPQRAVWIWA
jgi:hypothetical protein